MIQAMKAKVTKNKKGFTLAELLIVVAIIAILIAIAVPIFSAQLKKAGDRTIQSNMRSAISAASTQYLMDEPTGEEEYIFRPDDKGNLTVVAGPAVEATDYTVIMENNAVKTIKHPKFSTGEVDTLEPNYP